MKSLLTFAFLSSVALAATACGSSSSGDDQPAGTPGTFQQTSAKASLGQSVSQIANIKQGGDAQSAALALLGGANAYQGFVTPAAAGAPASESIGSRSAALGTCECKGTTCTFMDCGDSADSKMSGTTSVTGDHVVIDLRLDSTSSGSTIGITMKCDLMLPAGAMNGSCTTNGDVKTNAGGMAIDVTFATTATYAVKLTNGSVSGGEIDVSSSSTYAGMEYTGSGKVSFP